MGQSNFAFEPLVDLGGGLFTISAALGDGTFKYTDNERGKPVQLKASAKSAYELTAAGAEIEAFVETVEPFTVNQGLSFGTIRRGGRVYAKVGANQGATAMKVRDLVVADVQLANGAGDNYARVKTGTPATFKWRAIKIIGDGTANSLVLLERA